MNKLPIAARIRKLLVATIATAALALGFSLVAGVTAPTSEAHAVVALCHTKPTTQHAVNSANVGIWVKNECPTSRSIVWSCSQSGYGAYADVTQIPGRAGKLVYKMSLGEYKRGYRCSAYLR
ncbi:MAG: hypothetical protein FWD29_08735 [Micrococcales bacterium]|nr:hypothetical protein [Micrococcales bacterium]